MIYQNRLLFLLHQYNLSNPNPAGLVYDRPRCEKMSRSALDTAARIMVDVAESLVHSGHKSMPLCCSYICHMAHQHIESDQANRSKKDQAQDLKTLEALTNSFRQLDGS